MFKTRVAYSGIVKPEPFESIKAPYVLQSQVAYPRTSKVQTLQSARSLM